MVEARESSYVRGKRKLYIERGGRCESPFPCNERRIEKLEVDHFTPKCIGHERFWTNSDLNQPMNLQLLCHECHVLKDRTTCHALEQVRKELRGEPTYMEFFDLHRAYLERLGYYQK